MRNQTEDLEKQILLIEGQGERNIHEELMAMMNLVVRNKILFSLIYGILIRYTI
jgi:hypothetical protein